MTCARSVLPSRKVTSTIYTPAVPAVRLSEVLKRPVGEWRDVVKNDFEPHIFAAHPEIANLKQQMYEAGAIYASMSGSGSAVFGLFEAEPHLDLGDEVFLHVEHIN